MRSRGLDPSFNGCQDVVHLLWYETGQPSDLGHTWDLVQKIPGEELDGAEVQLGTNLALDPSRPAGMGIVEGCTSNSGLCSLSESGAQT